MYRFKHGVKYASVQARRRESARHVTRQYRQTCMRSWNIFLHRNDLMRERDVRETHLVRDLTHT